MISYKISIIIVLVNLYPYNIPETTYNVAWKQLQLNVYIKYLKNANCIVVF